MIDYKILVPASTSDRQMLNNFKNSYNCYKNDFAEEPIFFGDPTQTSCYHSKMIRMHEALNKINSEYVIVLDGFDLILNKELDEGLFDEFSENEELSFLFGAEANCFPYPQYKDLFDEQADVDAKLKYLNGGVIIAKREAYLDALTEYLNPDKHNQAEFLRNSDQVMYTLMYKNSIEQGDNKVKIDTQGRVSVQMFMLERFIDYSVMPNKQLVFLETGTIPYFVHFNGSSKDQMANFGIKYGE